MSEANRAPSFYHQEDKRDPFGYKNSLNSMKNNKFGMFAPTIANNQINATTEVLTSRKDSSQHGRSGLRKHSGQHEDLPEYFTISQHGPMYQALETKVSSLQNR